MVTEVEDENSIDTGGCNGQGLWLGRRLHRRRRCGSARYSAEGLPPEGHFHTSWTLLSREADRNFAQHDMFATGVPIQPMSNLNSVLYNHVIWLALDKKH